MGICDFLYDAIAPDPAPINLVQRVAAGNATEPRTPQRTGWRPPDFRHLQPVDTAFDRAGYSGFPGIIEPTPAPVSCPSQRVIRGFSFRLGRVAAGESR